MVKPTLNDLERRVQNYRCATCKIKFANRVYYNIPFCSEECYDKHSPACHGCQNTGGHWIMFS